MPTKNELQSDIFLKTKELLFFRLALAFASLGITVLFNFVFKNYLAPPLILTPIVFVIFYSAAALLLLKYRIAKTDEKLGLVNGLLIACDIISLTGLTYLSGGVDSDLYVLYLLPILLSSYTFGGKGIFVTAFFVSVSYLCLLWVENKSYIYIDGVMHGSLTRAYIDRLWQKILERGALLVGVSFIWAKFCEHMSHVAQYGADRLREQLAQNTKLITEMGTQAKRERLINSINSAIRSTLDLNQTLETAVDELCKALKVAECAIVYPGREKERKIVIVRNSCNLGNSREISGTTHGVAPTSVPYDSPLGRVTHGVAPISVPRDTSAGSPMPSITPRAAPTFLFNEQICQFILDKRSTYGKSPHDGTIIKTFVFAKPQDNPFFQVIKDELISCGITSLVVNPMMYADESKGILLIGEQNKERAWSTSELDLIKSVAGQVSVAIEHAELVDELSFKNKDLLNKNLRLDAKNLELKAVQSKLIHQEKMASLGRLVAGIAHELNNPINFVHGNLPYLREYFGDLKRLIGTLESLPEADGKAVSRLKREFKYDFLMADLDNIFADLNDGSERIRHIIRNLRSFSRLDEAELKEASIEEGIESTVKILSQYYGRDKIPLELSFGQIPPVICYPGQLNQVWMNLLSNAAEAVSHQKEPRVRIKALSADGKVTVSIWDNGPGVKPEVQSKIFEPFFTTKPIGQGTGLGLSICHSIVERHGGQIWCESKLDEGTTFTVQIPISPSLLASSESKKE